MSLSANPSPTDTVKANGAYLIIDAAVSTRELATNSDVHIARAAKRAAATLNEILAFRKNIG